MPTLAKRATAGIIAPGIGDTPDNCRLTPIPTGIVSRTSVARAAVVAGTIAAGAALVVGTIIPIPISITVAVAIAIAIAIATTTTGIGGVP